MLNPLAVIGLMDGNWMCLMVNVEYNETTYPCPVFDWITKKASSFAVGKGTFYWCFKQPIKPIVPPFMPCRFFRSIMSLVSQNPKLTIIKRFNACINDVLNRVTQRCKIFCDFY